MRPYLLLAAAATTVLITSTHADPAAARATITRDVHTIASPGAQALALVTADAFPVVLGGSGKNLREPVVAAARCRRGRVVAFAHGGYLGAKDHDTPRMVRNAITWAAGREDETPPDEPTRVAYRSVAADAIHRLAEGQPWRTALLTEAASLREADVLVLKAANLDDAMIKAIVRWVRGGGGLVVAATGWGWQQLNPQRDLAVDGPMNRLGTELGIVWTNDTVRDTGRDSFTIEPDVDPALFNAAYLLEMLVERPGDVPRDKPGRRQFERTLVQAVRATDVRHGPLAPQLARLERDDAAAMIPTPEEPIRSGNIRARLAILLDLERLEQTAPAPVPAHPAARAFPGLQDDAARGIREHVTVDLSVPRWQSTGLYAMPGKTITIMHAGDDQPAGLAVRIGCHKDWIGGKDEWKRMPRVTMETPLEERRTRVTSAFGGLVYIVVPSKKRDQSGTVQFTIKGAIAAPTYVHGKTTLDDWQRTERHHPAPWGELICDRVILSLPAEVLRPLDDPATLMDLWTRVLDACADLAQRPRSRTSPERIVTDVQISAGYMHSGYPIMTHLDKRHEFADVAKLLDGSWGIYHELGHNHQSGLWTFGGTTEVTCNLFALYVYETVCGKGLDSEELHGGIVPDTRAMHIATAYGAERASFDLWKRKPFVALTMYVQLAEAFGWDAYKAVFAEYRDLPRDARPRSDAEKRDEWLVRFSRHVGRDLGPFFDQWGVPVSAKAKASIADLPVWTPPDVTHP